MGSIWCYVVVVIVLGVGIVVVFCFETIVFSCNDDVVNFFPSISMTALVSLFICVSFTFIFAL